MYAEELAKFMVFQYPLRIVYPCDQGLHDRIVPDRDAFQYPLRIVYPCDPVPAQERG